VTFYFLRHFGFPHHLFRATSLVPPQGTDDALTVCGNFPSSKEFEDDDARNQARTV
jgi:hypothetical protein